MPYSRSISVKLGPGSSGLAATLRARLVASNGVTVPGHADLAGLVEVVAGEGDYLWTYTAFPDGFLGAVVFSASGADLVAASVEPPLSLAGVEVPIDPASIWEYLVSGQPAWVHLHLSACGAVGNLAKRSAGVWDMIDWTDPDGLAVVASADLSDPLSFRVVTVVHPGMV
jgi:hypothetical protein